MGSASKRMAARWLANALLGLFVGLAMSCTSAPDVNTATTQQAIEQGACGSSWIYSWYSPWSGQRTEFIVPSNVWFSYATTAQISFTDGSNPAVTCNYTTGGFVNCSSGAFNGSRLYATTVSISASNGYAWAEASFTENDGNSCTTDVCVSGTPTHGWQLDGYICDTSDACRMPSTCSSGVCTQGSQLPVDDGNACTTEQCDPGRGIYNTGWTCGSPPSAPPVVDSTISTAADFWNNVSSLYTGTETIDPARASVVRGRVKNASGTGVANVAVSVLGHNYGTVYTSGAGFYDIVVNGGGGVVLNFVGPGTYLRAQRRANARWHDYTVLEDLVLVADMNQNDKQTITRNSGSWQVGHGATEYEGGKTRTARVFFPPGWDIDTGQSGWTPSGSTLTFGAVEYTAKVPAAMPGELPAMSRYTYATRFAFDEALDVPKVVFNMPAILYVEGTVLENDANNLPGKEVPAGSYDTTRGVWVTEATGTIVKITAHQGGLVLLDLGGKSEGELGITTGEKQQLALAYPSDGVVLWRVRAAHFSDYDFNWAGGMPLNPAMPPSEPPAPTKLSDDKTCHAGSIIECENQILGEQIAIPGTPYALRYQSDRQVGYYPGFTVRLTPAQSAFCGGMGPACPIRIELHVEVAGQKSVQSFANIWPNIIGTFTWDRKDAYQRIVQGGAMAHIEMRWIYQAVTKATPGFGAPPKQVTGGSRENSELYVSRFYEMQLGAFDAKPLGFGGWTLSPHHVYDPGTVTLFEGNGGRQSGSSISAVAKTVMGGGGANNGDNFPAAGANLGQFTGFAVSATGAVYSADDSFCRIRSFDSAGRLTTVVGADNCTLPTNWQDGDSATATNVSEGGNPPLALAIGPDDSLYAINQPRGYVFRVTGGKLYAVAGTSASSLGFNDGPAAQAQFNTNSALVPALAVARDGNVYVADTGNNRIRRIRTDKYVETIAGSGSIGTCFPADGTAVTALSGVQGANINVCNPDGIAVGPDGLVYYSVVDGSQNQSRVYKLRNDGTVVTVAGGGQTVSDNVAATTSKLKKAAGLAFDSAGNLYIADEDDFRIRRVDTNGIITTVVNTLGIQGDAQLDGLPAPSTKLHAPHGVAIGPDGYLYYLDWGAYPVGGGSVTAVRRVSTSGLIRNGNWLFPLAGDVLELDPAGRHLRTLHGIKGAYGLEMGYTTNLLTSIKEYAGVDNTTFNTTSIARNGSTVTITPAFNTSLVTTITLDGNGYAQKIAWPDSATCNQACGANTCCVLLNHGTGGLLQQYTDARGNPHTFTYQADGRLKNDKNPMPNTVGATLSRTYVGSAYDVVKKSAEQRTNVFRLDYLAGTWSDAAVQAHGARTQRRVSSVPGIDSADVFDIHQDATRRTRSVLDRGGQGEAAITSEETTFGPDMANGSTVPRFGFAAPQWTTITRYNGGLHNQQTHTHDLQLSNASDVFSTTSITDTTAIAYDNKNETWTRAFNAASNKWTTTSPLGSKVEQTVDSRERVTTVHWPGTVPVSLSDVNIARDSSNGRVTSLGQGARTYTINYDGPTGYVSSIVDNALQRTWSYCSISGCGGSSNDRRDLVGRPIQQTLPGNGQNTRTVKLGWDGSGNLLSLTPPDTGVCSGTSCMHTFAPGVTDLLSLYQPPSLGFSGNTSYSYDRDGLGTAVGTPSDTVTYTYDPQGRIVQRSTSYGGVTYCYASTNGLLSSVTAANTSCSSPSGGPTISYSYMQGQSWGTLPTSVTYSNVPINNSPYNTSHAFAYGYDGRFRVTSRKIDGANEVDYSYDADGAIAQVTLPGGTTFTVNRATGAIGTGLITSTVLQSTIAVTQTFGYNAYGEVTSLAASAWGSDFYNLTYGRDAGGRITTKDENTHGWFPEKDWSYDYWPGTGFLYHVNSCVPFACGNGNYRIHSYDSHGNRTAPFNPVYDKQDRMTTDGWYSLSYTNNGEYSYVSDPSSNYSQMSYDVLGNLRSMYQSYYGTSYSYVIDGFDRRVGRRVNGSLTNLYLYDDQNRIIAELNPSNGSLLSQFVYVTHAHVPDLLIRSGGDAYVFVHDQLGSPVELVSTWGGVYQKRAYDPWGVIVYDSTTLSQPFGFAGGLYDDQIGYRFGARDYNPWWGKWNSKDQTRFEGGLSLYSYCDGDPINCFDFTGNGPFGEGAGFVFGAALGGIVGWNLGMATGFVAGLPTGPGEIVAVPAGAILGGYAGNARCGDGCQGRQRRRGWPQGAIRWS